MNVKSNELVRNMLIDYWKRAFEPNLKLVAEQIEGISYFHLVRFKNGQDISQKSLNCILEFLHKQQKQVI